MTQGEFATKALELMEKHPSLKDCYVDTGFTDPFTSFFDAVDTALCQYQCAITIEIEEGKRLAKAVDYWREQYQKNAPIPHPIPGRIDNNPMG